MKKALLVVSFGTSYTETYKKNILSCETRLAEEFPDRDCFRAFTSEMIIKKIAKRDGKDIYNPQRALQKLYEQGYEDVAVQSLHIINGDEYEKVARQVSAFEAKFKRLHLGAPLLSDFSDFEKVMSAVQNLFPSLNHDEHVVLMGHGATHHAFTAYACLDHMFQARNLPFHVGAVESYPEVGLVVDRLVSLKAKKIHLMPLMLVAGDHATNDMASDEDDSWKSLMQKSGIGVQVWLQGLGENSAIRELFVEHLLHAIQDVEDEAVR
ncbi:sirohydrochlorin cobaltochelatase [Vibrio salinus]|uniref:sirohydrochlorin cobaltochelatase n=1 Tax=Vibrio salinus TaxID=2899784 RepID=UPI001E5F9180|nr:sirohydrochlorin cobaltochelatase [Vibrio salinus]MCE0495672.1 sirohydrochlorin cobaltochelatase [Vibrio salinus]